MNTLLVIKFNVQNILDKQTHLSHPFIYCQVNEKTEASFKNSIKMA